MKNHLEIEYKTLLDQESYQGLLAEFADVSPIKQTNYYIDSPKADLKQRGCSLRIRILADRAELTLKIPQVIGNQEYNQELSLETAQQLLAAPLLPEGEIKQLLSFYDFPLDILTVWGSLSTLRYEKSSPIGLLALDKNSYAQQIDYELELEVEDAEKGEHDFACYLERHAIPFRAAQSKVARAAAALLKK